MSSKIEVSRGLAERILKRLDQAASAFKATKPERNELRALLAAPVVERQPVDDSLSKGFYTTETGGGKYAINIGFRSMADMQSADQELRDLLRMRTAPPELAELQATIARQAAEIERLNDELSACITTPGGCSYWRESSRLLTQENERLKGGQGEPVPVVLPERVNKNFYGEYSPYDSGWNACLDKVKELNQ